MLSGMSCLASAGAITGASVAQLAIVQPFESRTDMASAVELLVANGAVSVVCSALLGRAAPESPSDADMLLVDQLALVADVLVLRGPRPHCRDDLSRASLEESIAGPRARCNGPNHCEGRRPRVGCSR